MASTFSYGIEQLTIGIALQIARGEIQGKLTAAAIQKIKASHDEVKKLLPQAELFMV
ncbi:MAG: hypothetical protein R2796_10750 [Chitinophagaceae bacterium]